jgi:hypothetical protein
VLADGRASTCLIGRPSNVFVGLGSSLIIALVTCRLFFFVLFDGMLEEEEEMFCC